jgi:hypothetical protein
MYNINVFIYKFVCNVADFEAEKIRVTKDIEDRNRELTLQLKAFQELFEAERNSRLQRVCSVLC